MEIQYYPKWRWPWYNKTYDGICGWEPVYSNYAGIGPLQFHWYSSK